MKIVIAGAGTYGQVYLHYLKEESDFEVAGFVDDDPAKRGAEILGVPVLGNTQNFAPLIEAGIEGVIAPIGNNAARVDILSRAQEQGLATPSYFHPSAIIPSTTSFGDAVYILAGTVLMPYVELQDFVMISIGSRINHHSRISRGAFVSNGVNLGANVTIAEQTSIGMGATIMTGVKTIGAHATIGAGAVIIRDVPPGATVVGNPGRVIRVAEVPPKEGV